MPASGWKSAEPAREYGPRTSVTPSKRAPHASSAARELSTPGGASSTSPFSSSSVSPLSASSARQPSSDSCASRTHSASG